MEQEKNNYEELRRLKKFLFEEQTLNFDVRFIENLNIIIN